MSLKEAEDALPKAIAEHEAALAALDEAKKLVPDGDTSEPAPEVRAKLEAAHAEHARASKARVDAEARYQAELTLFGLK